MLMACLWGKCAIIDVFYGSPSNDHMVACSAFGVFCECAMLKLPEERRNGASQRERGGGGEREEKTPARKYCENEKHPLIRRAWPLFQKWVADNDKTISHSSAKTSIVLRKISWSLSLFLSWLSHNAILHSWWSFSLTCNSFFYIHLCKSLSVRV